jgi:hypothetical protein
MNPDFITAICEEFAWEIEAVVETEFLTPQECWDPVVKVFGWNFDPVVLAHITDTEIEQLRIAFADWFECESISSDHIRTAVLRLQARWPA